MSRPARPEPVAAIGECPVPPPLQNLEYRLLDESIQHRRNAQFSDTSPVRLGDFHPPHRLRFVSPVEQLFPDGRPVLFQVIRDSADGHPIHARTTFIGLHLPQCFLQVFSLTYFLHQSIRAGWVFGSIRRPGRFSLFPPRLSGFTRRRRREVQFHLDIPLLVVLEIHGLLASPSRSGLRPSFPAWSIHFSAFRLSECLTNLADVMTCRVGGGALVRWPPSAAQTVRAVFPHTAFTKAQSTRYDPGSAEWGRHRTCQVDPVRQSPRTMMYGFFPKELIHLIALTHLPSLLFPPAFACRLPRPTPVADDA